MQNLLKTVKKLSSFVRKQRSIACVVRLAGETVTEQPVVVFRRQQPLWNIQSREKSSSFQQKSGRNNRNSEETAKNGFVVHVLVVFVVVIVDRSSIGFGIGIGRRLEAVEASSSSFVVLPVAKVAATLLPIRQQ